MKKFCIQNVGTFFSLQKGFTELNSREKWDCLLARQLEQRQKHKLKVKKTMSIISNQVAKTDAATYPHHQSFS
jgi:hypothetical protein